MKILKQSQILQVLITFLVMLFVLPSNGQKKSSQFGKALVAGAAVYKSRSFDSPVIGYLEYEQKVRISVRRYEGVDGFGLFFKIRLKKGVFGYVPDTDVVPLKIAKKIEKDRPKKKDSKNKAEDDYKDKKEESLYFTKGLSLIFGSAQYKEIVSGTKLSSNISLFGAKLSGPGWLISEAPMDINILFSPSAPSYYDEQLSTTPSSGFVFLSTGSIKVPFADWHDKLFFGSLGMMLNYTSVNFVINDQPFDSQEIKMGVTAGLGFQLRPFKGFMMQLDAKYYYEKTTYSGVFASVGMEF